MQSQQVNEGTRVVDSRLQKMGMVSNACVVSGGNALRLNWFSAQLSPQRQCTTGLQKADTAQLSPQRQCTAGLQKADTAHRRQTLPTEGPRTSSLLEVRQTASGRMYVLFIATVVIFCPHVHASVCSYYGHGAITKKGSLEVWSVTGSVCSWVETCTTDMVLSLIHI